MKKNIYFFIIKMYQILFSYTPVKNNIDMMLMVPILNTIRSHLLPTYEFYMNDKFIYYIRKIDNAHEAIVLYGKVIEAFSGHNFYIRIYHTPINASVTLPTNPITPALDTINETSTLTNDNNNTESTDVDDTIINSPKKRKYHKVKYFDVSKCFSLVNKNDDIVTLAYSDNTYGERKLEINKNGTCILSKNTYIYSKIKINNVDIYIGMIVAYYFIDKSDHKAYLKFKDGDTTNYSIDNLVWCN